MYRIFVNFLPTITAFVLFLHVLGYMATLYLSSYLTFAAWLLLGCIDIVFILKVRSITRFFHKSMYIDTLTQLNNRNFFNVSISNAIKKLQKKQSYISLLIIDLDNFKDINDTYSHIVGDEILKQLSNILKRNITSTDIAIRWGGDEFVITLPGVSGKDAFDVGERIRRDIDNHYFFYNHTIFKITVSIGVTSIRNKMDINTFIDLVDKALYKAKISKNSVGFLHTCVDL